MNLGYYSNYGDYVNSTVQKFGGDLARPNKFSITLGMPKNIGLSKLKSKNIPPKFDVLCKSISIPALRNEPIEVKYKGHNLKVMGKTNFEQTINVTLYLDENHDLFSFVHSWLNAMDKKTIDSEISANSKTGKKTEDLLGNLVVKALNFDENFQKEIYEFKNVYPTAISELAFSSDTQGSVSEVTIEFAYSSYTVKDGPFDFSNIIMDGIQKGMDTAMDWLGLDESGKKVVNKGIPAAIDFFQKVKSRG